MLFFRTEICFLPSKVIKCKLRLVYTLTKIIIKIESTRVRARRDLMYSRRMASIHSYYTPSNLGDRKKMGFPCIYIVISCVGGLYWNIAWNFVWGVCVQGQGHCRKMFPKVTITKNKCFNLNSLEKVCTPWFANVQTG